MKIDFKNELIEIYEFVSNLNSPKNSNGLYKDFLKWVCDKWGSGYFFEDNIIESGLESSNHIKKTNKKLTETAKKYSEFIYSNNGQTISTGSGLIAELYIQDLNYDLGTITKEKIIQFVQEKKYNLPQKYMDNNITDEDLGEYVYEIIFEGDFEEKEEQNVADQITTFVEDTICENYECPKTIFSDWTLDNFKKEYSTIIKK